MNVLHSVLRAPTFDDEDKTRAAALLNTLLVACFAGAILYISIVILFIPDERGRLIETILAIPIVSGLMVVLRWGHVRLASILLVAMIWVLIAFASYSAGGVQSDTFDGFILAILIAGFLLGPRAGIYVVMLTLITGIAFVAGENSPDFPPLRISASPMVLFAHSIFFIVSAVLLYLVMRSLQMAFARTQLSERRLNDNNHLLQHEVEERQRAEAALRASEEQYRQLFDANPNPMYVVDVETRTFLAVNNMMVEKYGYNPDEFLKMNLSSIISLEEIPGVQTNAADFRQRGIDYSISGPWRHLKKDGTSMFVEISFHRMNYNGQKALVCASYDLTERLQAEEAVRRSQELFSKVFQAAPMGIAISTIDEGRILSMNQYGLDITGYEEHEVINQRVSDLGVWYLPALQENFIKYLSKDGSMRDQEAILKMKNGTALDVLISMETIEVGGKACVLSIFNDITARKQAEQERLEAEKLRLELHKEREVLQMKEGFVASMSHEFRTPLAIILSAKESLEYYFDRLTPEQRLQKLHNIGEQTHYIVDMLDQVLLLGKAQARKLQFKPVTMDIAAFCQKLFEQIQLTDKTSHRYLFAANGSLPAVQADEQLLQHILINLLSNAIKYSPADGEIQLTLSQDRDDVVIQVSDQGIGIPLEDQKRLFEAFFRASNIGKIKGNGLGLAIVKESVEVHRGTISYESTEGKGSTFTIRLPLGEASHTETSD